MANVREALIAEALGDIAAMLDRLEAITPALTTTCAAVTSAADALAAKSTEAESRFVAFTEQAATPLIKQVARRADELVRAVAAVETQALQAAARQILHDELRPSLQRLARSLDEHTQQRWLHWPSVGVGAVTAIAASAATWAGVLYLLPR